MLIQQVISKIPARGTAVDNVAMGKIKLANKHPTMGIAYKSLIYNEKAGFKQWYAGQIPIETRQ